MARPSPGGSVEQVGQRCARWPALCRRRVEAPGRRPYAQLRFAARLLRLGASVVDVGSGERYRRVLIPARMANLVAGWGPEGDAQAQAAAEAFPGAAAAPIAWIDSGAAL